MKTKTIKIILAIKMNEWLDTINDDRLRKKVKDNLLVSGGSITSMLLNEPVNDYDVYIQDMDVLKELANYYCKGRVLDGRKRDSYIKDRFPEYDELEDRQQFEKYQAEHFIRIKNLKPDQIKLDVPSVGIRTENLPKEPQKDYTVAFLSQNAISLTDDIQIVVRFNGSPKEIHKTFDFIHATNYFTFKDGLVLNQRALESILTKNLQYQGSLYPLTSIIRMKKFIHRGWTMNAGEVLKIMFQISELNLRDLEVLEEQLIGVDVAYFAILIEALRAVPTKKITSNFINTMIDKIFNSYDEEINIDQANNN